MGVENSKWHTEHTHPILLGKSPVFLCNSRSLQPHVYTAIQSMVRGFIPILGTLAPTCVVNCTFASYEKMYIQYVYYAGMRYVRSVCSVKHGSVKGSHVIIERTNLCVI